MTARSLRYCKKIMQWSFNINHGLPYHSSPSGWVKRHSLETENIGISENVKANKVLSFLRLVVHELVFGQIISVRLFEQDKQFKCTKSYCLRHIIICVYIRHCRVTGLSSPIKWFLYPTLASSSAMVGTCSGTPLGLQGDKFLCWRPKCVRYLPEK